MYYKREFNASYFKIIEQYSIYIQVIGMLKKGYRASVKIIIKLQTSINLKKSKFKINRRTYSKSLNKNERVINNNYII